MSKSNNSAEMNLHYKRRNGDQDCHVGHTCTGSSGPWGTKERGRVFGGEFISTLELPGASKLWLSSTEVTLY
jgi:hypothetical protein